MDYGTGPGDFANPLALDPQQGENFGHPSLRTQAQLQVRRRHRSTSVPDHKLVNRPSRSGGTTHGSGTAPHLGPGVDPLPSPNTPIPMIKNEELILLRAEANIGLSDLGRRSRTSTWCARLGRAGALRRFADQTVALTELLYNKRYSLLFEGGHRWIDCRRYGRLATSELDRAGPPPDVIFTTLPIPTAETLPRQ